MNKYIKSLNDVKTCCPYCGSDVTMVMTSDPHPPDNTCLICNSHIMKNDLITKEEYERKENKKNGRKKNGK